MKLIAYPGELALVKKEYEPYSGNWNKDSLNKAEKYLDNLKKLISEDNEEKKENQKLLIKQLIQMDN
ncbi:hypothetical protein ATX59_07435 [Oenococcus oeni]|uniref:Uncharacterized protein n=1 Tax=Oenococcus oeni TaxID=1247 RepID=A0A6N4A7N0_OENOE|nr:hypothetical protein ATX59_07435 [Oenococcus oeni]